MWEEKNYNEADDPFLKHFDVNGNFIEIIEPQIEEEPPTINYTFKENKD